MPTESETERPAEDKCTEGSSDMLQSGVAQDSEDHAGCKAAGVVLWTNDGRILVGRGTTKREWSEPGGKRERGETARACASRELYEEMRLSADDLEIDWDKPSYDEQCKYTFFHGRLGDRMPAPTAVFTEYKYAHIHDATDEYTFRLKRVVTALATSTPRPRPAGLLSCWAIPTEAAATSTSSTGRAKKSGAKRKIDAVSGEEAGIQQTMASSASQPASVATTDDSVMLTAKGRHVVLQDLTYRIDAAALEAYAATPEAKSTRTTSDDPRARKLTEHELIRRFLDGGRVKRLPDGTGICTFSYAASPIGDELYRQGFLENGGRLYPDDWPSATDLPKKLRNCALGAQHVEMDDSNAFHRYLQCLTTSSMARAVLEDLVQDNSYRSCLAEHYFGDKTRTEPVKILFHMLANNGS